MPRLRYKQKSTESELLRRHAYLTKFRSAFHQHFIRTAEDRLQKLLGCNSSKTGGSTTPSCSINVENLSPCKRCERARGAWRILGPRQGEPVARAGELKPHRDAVRLLGQPRWSLWRRKAGVKLQRIREAWLAAEAAALANYALQQFEPAAMDTADRDVLRYERALAGDPEALREIARLHQEHIDAGHQKRGALLPHTRLVHETVRVLIGAGRTTDVQGVLSFLTVAVLTGEQPDDELLGNVADAMANGKRPIELPDDRPPVEIEIDGDSVCFRFPSYPDRYLKLSTFRNLVSNANSAVSQEARIP